MATAKHTDEGVVIVLPSRVDDPSEPYQEDVRLEALRWLRELNDTYEDGGAKVYSMLSSTVQPVHHCQPPQAYVGQDEARSWQCASCGTLWHLRVLAEGRGFGDDAGPFLWGEWVPESAG